MAGASGWLAHRRMRKVEAELGEPASPGRERALLWYAGASVVWLSAAALAAVGLLKRERVRVGRDCFFILLGHFSLVTMAASLSVALQATGGSEATGPVLTAVTIVAGSAIAATVFAWKWAGLRAARLMEGPKSEATDPGAVRFLIYALSLAFWPAGFVAGFVYTHREDAQVGCWAIRCSLLHLLGIALAVCVGLAVLVVVMPAP
jgi:hypothetical protein